MLLQTHFTPKTLTAQITNVRAFSCMCPLVNNSDCLPRKTLFTKITFVYFSIEMIIQMFLPRVPESKSVIAHVTNIGLVSGMHPFVVDTLRLQMKTFFTETAFVGFHNRMPSQMIIQNWLTTKASITQATNIGLRSCMHPFMNHALSLLTKTLFTETTFVRLLIGMCF